MNDKDLLVGTRPAIEDGRIIMTGSAHFDGYEIMEYLGMAWGISVRAKDIGQDWGMLFKNWTGGELESYTALGDECRQRAIDRMLEKAGRLGANGLINVRFELTGASRGVSQVVVHGTAVRIEPIKHYVPTGAMGNLVVELIETLKKVNSGDNADEESA